MKGKGVEHSQSVACDIYQASEGKKRDCQSLVCHSLGQYFLYLLSQWYAAHRTTSAGWDVLKGEKKGRSLIF